MRWEGEFAIGADHPSLPGHFPGNPIVPGVVILDEVVAALRAALPGLRVAGMAQVKFLAPLRPGESVRLVLEQTSDTQAQFQCRARDTVIASGSLRLAPGEAQ
jgi:3-hydroxymyristoyl/3-hydroxydecanoyl-(acyl carrier protein) dehydratase